MATSAAAASFTTITLFGFLARSNQASLTKGRKLCEASTAGTHASWMSMSDLTTGRGPAQPWFPSFHEPVSVSH